ncbi:MAG: alpha/beta hydrolase [Hyphomonadaceae bacterium]|nr:alpha/beta hydrolase [Hyphomonadaceae bacterium]MBC6412570.1 alpha/beta hydrolase [Hyphomonadaceae bacterium]
MMKSPKDLVDDLRAQLEKLKPGRDEFYRFHHNFHHIVNQFEVPGPKMAETKNFHVPDDDFPVPVRLYVPYGACNSPGPCIIFLHGGGFVTCSPDTHEIIALRLASGSGYRVLSVDYRLAPQHKFPAALEDCEKVLNRVLDGYGEDCGLSRHEVALCGDSAGGNMAAYLSQKHRKKISCQILFYPLLQFVELKPAIPGPQDILPLGFTALKFIKEHYVAGADTRDTRLSPLLERDLTGVPPTHILTCGLDPLRMEGRAYAENLRTAGVRVVEIHEKAMPHGFLNFSGAFPKARRIPLDAADFVREHMPSG